MDCLKLYGARYIFAYIMIAELYVMWFITIGFEYYYSIIILYANALLLCAILNDNVPFLEYSIRKNWQCYIYIAYWFYGHNAIKYTYENNCPHVHSYSYGIPIHLPVRNDIYVEDAQTLSGIEYIEYLLY